MTRIVLALAGYEPGSDQLGDWHPIPEDQEAAVLAVIGRINDGWDGEMELSNVAAFKIANLIGAKIDPERHRYFLDGGAVMDPIPAPAAPG